MQEAFIIKDLNVDDEEFDYEMPSPMEIAAFVGNKVIVAELMKYGAGKSFNDYEMSCAIEGGNIEIVEMLLNAGMKNLNRENILEVLEILDEVSYEALDSMEAHYPRIEDENRTKYSVETVRNRIAIVKKIIAKIIELKTLFNKKDIEDYLYDEEIFLFLVEQGDIESVKELLEIGKRTSEEMGEALYIAASCGHVDLVEELLRNGAEVDYRETCKQTPLLEATKRGNIDVMELLIKNGANINETTGIGENTALMLGVYYNQIDAVRALLKHGAQVEDPGIKNETASMIASRLDNIEMSNELREAREQAILVSNTIPNFNRDKKKEEPPKEPIKRNKKEDEQNKVSKKNNTTANNTSTLPPSEIALINAVEINDLEKVQKIIKMGLLKNKIFKNSLDINITDKEGRTPLTVAAYNGNLEIVRELLLNGASVNKANSQGETPIMKTSENGKLEVVRELLKKRGRIDCADEKGETAVMKAVENGHTDLAKELIWKGIEIDKRDNSGRTLLMIASQKGNTEIVKVLKELGAEVDKLI